MPGWRKIDYGEASVTKTNRPVLRLPHAYVVGSAVRHGVPTLDEPLMALTCRPGSNSNDPTHCRARSLKRALGPGYDKGVWQRFQDEFAGRFFARWFEVSAPQTSGGAVLGNAPIAHLRTPAFVSVRRATEIRWPIGSRSDTGQSTETGEPERANRLCAISSDWDHLILGWDPPDFTDWDRRQTWTEKRGSVMIAGLVAGRKGLIQAQKHQMKFRSDINGLRALAVLPVLCFHAKLPLFSGGFLGVDVFFVISGYLITEKLLASFVSGEFSYANFYDNRIRRIIPALLVVSICTTVLSFFFMLPYSLKNYGESLIATTLSTNNILLYLTSGYWALAAEFKPLYHTWSLGVEEQYYLVAPLLLYVFYRYIDRRNAAICGVAVLLAVSFFLTLAASDKEFKFLIIFFRAWELLAGAMLALSADKNRNRPVFTALGLLLLLMSYAAPYLLAENQAFVVAIPVIGTCLIIRFSNISSFPGKLLALKPLAFVGLISYSVYLWHQPILAFVRLSSAQEPNHLELLGFSLLSLPLGYGSWRYVENVFRNKGIVSGRVLYCTVGILAGLNLLVGYTLYRTYGLQGLAPQFAYGTAPQLYVAQAPELLSTSFRNNGRFRVLVVGNSFALDYINMMRETGHLDSLDVVYTDVSCPQRGGSTLDALLVVSDLVVYSNDWGRVPDNGQLAVANSCYQYMRYRSSGRVVILGVKNFGWNNDFVRLAHRNFTDIRVAPLLGVTTFNQSAKALFGRDYVDVLSLISDQAGNVPVFTPDGKFITYDANHLTKAGAQYVGTKIFGRYGFLVGEP
jgi:peptidoglycan/LPS O-acetylase OafA/YrhL